MSSTQVVVRRAQPSDTQDILEFFRLVRRKYITFGREDLPYILKTGLALVAQTGPLIWGVLAISPKAPGWGQVRALGLIDGWQANAGVGLLMKHVRTLLEEHHIHTLYAIMHETWLQGPLESAGFKAEERLITYLRHAHSIPEVPEEPAHLRIILPEELDLVAQVDEAAFPPQWHYTERELAHMLATGCRLIVAIHDDQIVGYSCVDAQGDVGHIARLAVHPLWQGRGIGRQLLLDAMHYLSAAGAIRISLNTQSSNRRAIHLYENLHFRRFGRVVPILTRTLQ